MRTNEPKAAPGFWLCTVQCQSQTVAFIKTTFGQRFVFTEPMFVMNVNDVNATLRLPISTRILTNGHAVHVV